MPRYYKLRVVLFCQYCEQAFLVHPCKADRTRYCSILCGELARTWTRIDTSGGPDACWEWQGARHRQGYGKVRRHGRDSFAHRLAYADTYGPIPADKQVNHKCNNPPCCNPRHLYAGTSSDNAGDAIRRGTKHYTFLPGEAHCNAKLTEQDIKAILLFHGVLSSYKVSQKFPVSASNIRRIWARQQWKHVTQNF